MSAEQETDQERRITFCLYESWEKIAGSSGLPALKRLQRQEIEAFKSNLVLLDLRNGKDNPNFQVIGNGLTEDLEIDLVGRPLSEVPRRSMLSRVTDHYLEVLANRVPIAFEAEFVNLEGEKALYRGILLPFSDDNQNINFILGGVRWILAKDVLLDEDKPTIEELMRTIASGKDEISLEREDGETFNEDDLDTTTAPEAAEDSQREDTDADAVLNHDETINLESDPSEEDAIAVENIIFEEPPINEVSTETTSEEIPTSEENLIENVEPVNVEAKSIPVDNVLETKEPDPELAVEEAINIGDALLETDDVTEEQIVFEEPPINEVSIETTSEEKPTSEEILIENIESAIVEAELVTEDSAPKIEEAETEHTVEETINTEVAPLETDYVTEEQVVFEEPLIDEVTQETTSEEVIFSEETSITQEDAANYDADTVADETYLEIDGTTSFEEDIIEELTATPEDLDVSDANFSEQPEVQFEDNDDDVETEDDTKEGDTLEAVDIIREEPAVKEKLKKRAKKGSVIERSMEMLLGKSKKKDIFGHEIRSAESKITLPTQPDPNDELDIIDEHAEVDFDENESNLNTPEQNQSIEVSEPIIDVDNNSEDPSVMIKKGSETVSDTISASFEDEINKVMDDAIDEHIIDVDEVTPEIIKVDSTTTVDPLDGEILLDDIDENNIEKTETVFQDTHNTIVEDTTNTEEVTSYEIAEEEIKEESSIKLENELHEEISAQEEELLETPVAESNQSNIALETDTSDVKEEITFDVTEAEDIADDAIIIEQQVASSEPIITDTSHDIPAQKEEISEEDDLQELQDSLKQIIRYIKKEDASHNRSRDSLYNILTAIYKFHSVCENSSVAYSKLVAENGLKIQERAPFTPVLKICLGKDYDKTRLTEYAAALGIAKHMNVDVEDFHDFIKHFPGGIKGCVKEMRAIRKGSNGANLVQQSRTIEEARNVLRDMPVIGRIRLKKMIVSKDADEFCLLLAKRRGHDIDVLKVLDDQYTKIDPILKRAAFIKGNLKKEN